MQHPHASRCEPSLFDARNQSDIEKEPLRWRLRKQQGLPAAGTGAAAGASGGGDGGSSWGFRQRTLGVPALGNSAEEGLLTARTRATASASGGETGNFGGRYWISSWCFQRRTLTLLEAGTKTGDGAYGGGD